MQESYLVRGLGLGLCFDLGCRASQRRIGRRLVRSWLSELSRARRRRDRGWLRPFRLRGRLLRSCDAVCRCVGRRRDRGLPIPFPLLLLSAQEGLERGPQSFVGLAEVRRDWCVCADGTGIVEGCLAWDLSAMTASGSCDRMITYSFRRWTGHSTADGRRSGRVYCRWRIVA